MEIKVPGLKEDIGLGDVVKKATSAIGIKPCPPCQERARKMNAMLSFKSKDGQQTAPLTLAAKVQPGGHQWTEYPNKPEGWIENEKCEKAVWFTNGNNHMVWLLDGNRYRQSHMFCGGGRDMAKKKYDDSCGE